MLFRKQPKSLLAVPHSPEQRLAGFQFRGDRKNGQHRHPKKEFEEQQLLGRGQGHEEDRTVAKACQHAAQGCQDRYADRGAMTAQTEDGNDRSQAGDEQHGQGRLTEHRRGGADRQEQDQAAVLPALAKEPENLSPDAPTRQHQR
jgi:hypothetical protein